MRTIFITLLLALSLTACGFFDDNVEEPAKPAVAGETTEQEAAAPAAARPDGTIASTNTVKDIPPDGLVGTVQMANGSTLHIVDLVKLGNYYLYLSGELNGRTSTVISFTRFQDLKRWDAFIFKDQSNFVIITKEGKEMVFMNSRLFIGSDSNDTYAFYTFNDYSEKVLIEVKKSDVASIKFE